MENHDRLDLKQQSLEYSSPLCGTVNKVTGKPDFCGFDCPFLKEIILAGKSPADPEATKKIEQPNQENGGL